jgi:hypothetical protein
VHAPHALVVVQTFTGIEFGTMPCVCIADLHKVPLLRLCASRS